jgi:hypothetical protein
MIIAGENENARGENVTECCLAYPNCHIIPELNLGLWMRTQQLEL